MAQTQAQDRSFRVAVVGGGIAGLSLAVGLLGQKAARPSCNVDLRIYEQADKFAEIGAGVAFGPNALQALKLLGLEQQIAKLGTSPEETRNIWFEYRFATADHPESGGLITTITGEDAGKGNVHRADFLDELIKLVPQDVCNFGHLLSDYEEHDDGITLKFANGQSHEADIVIACDGIKSRTRKCMFSKIGQTEEGQKEKYAQWIAWRGLIPVAKFEEHMGRPGTIPIMWCGLDRHILTFPVKGGKMVNLVGFVRDPEEKRLGGRTSPWVEKGTHAAMLEDFASFRSEIKTLLESIAEPSIWGIFDLPALNTTMAGRVILAGDAAHATTPHQGSGAGQAIEDALFLSHFLTHSRIADSSSSPADRLKGAEIYNSYRHERAAKVQITSAESGLLYEGRGVGGEGHDKQKMKSNLDERMKWIWNYDIAAKVKEMCAQLDSL